MGMHPDAASGWTMICTSPVSAFAVYFSSLLVAAALLAGFFVTGLPWPTWLTLIPVAILVAGAVVYAAAMFHNGPSFATQPISGILVLLILLSGVELQLVCFIGPERYIPFGNIAITTVCMMMTTFLMSLSTECGGIAANFPAQPHATLCMPIMEAALTTVRFVSAMTDFALARVMFRQACSLPRHN